MANSLRRALLSSLRTIHQTIDILVAVLLLTGQVTIRAVIFTTGGEFRVTVSGPIFGSERAMARPGEPGAAGVLDSLDIALALLLILGLVQASGMFLQNRRFSIQIGGPAFGSAPTEVHLPEARAFFSEYRDHLITRYGGGN